MQKANSKLPEKYLKILSIQTDCPDLSEKGSCFDERLKIIWKTVER